MKIKKFFTGMVAGVMAVGMMSIEASAAQSWSVRFYPAQAPNGIQYTDINNFANSTSTSYFYDSCPNYTQSYNIYGVPAYVDYYGFYINSSGYEVDLCSSSHYYYYHSVSSLTKRNLSSSCPSNYVFKVKHTLHGNGNNSGMSGSVSLTNS